MENNKMTNMAGASDSNAVTNAKYEPVMGLEIHIQSKTKSKMFCPCDANYFGAEPNTHTCPVCLGLPGALPVPNEEAIKNCIKLSLAVNCEINKYSKFDRKNYFYPDLPKGFQISQYDMPFGFGGFVDITVNGENRKIGITRVHQEEDTGKSIHEDGVTKLDYNKSGMPLVEVVTEPDLRTADEVRVFAKKLKQIVEYIGVSDADMEKGQMRFELNISLRPVGDTKLPDYKVEVKNIGSISVLEKVVASEIERQTEILERGEVPTQETRGVVDMSGMTVSQRKKESSADYRYFPEPDIPLIELTDEYIEGVRAELPALFDARFAKYTGEWGIGAEVADIIASTREKADDFESLVADVTDTKVIAETAKWYAVEFAMYQNNDEVDCSKVEGRHIVDIASLVVEGKITGKTAKEVFAEVVETGKLGSEIVSEKGLEVMSDTGLIEEAVEMVIAANPKIVEDIKKNPNAIMALVGQVMRQMRGQVDAQTVRVMLEERVK